MLHNMQQFQMIKKGEQMHEIFQTNEELIVEDISGKSDDQSRTQLGKIYTLRIVTENDADYSSFVNQNQIIDLEDEKDLQGKYVTRLIKFEQISDYKKQEILQEINSYYKIAN